MPENTRQTTGLRRKRVPQGVKDTSEGKKTYIINNDEAHSIDDNDDDEAPSTGDDDEVPSTDDAARPSTTTKPLPPKLTSSVPIDSHNSTLVDEYIAELSLAGEQNHGQKNQTSAAADNSITGYAPYPQDLLTPMASSLPSL